MAGARRIAVLPSLVADQIAAGEVIERPASVAKELIENALDAGASEVHVTVRDGGRVLIAVRDDGFGMSPEDARLACLRHATSKLRRLDDLSSIASFGFRGEALASIAAVADVCLITRRRDDVSGVRLRLRQGVIEAEEPAGTPPGTVVEVAELFAQIPARRKFLRSAQTEGGHVTELVQRIALARPDVGFFLETDGRQSLRLPRVARVEERIAQVMGAARAAVMVPVDRVEGAITVRGCISRAGESYAQARGLLTYVNGRLVRDRVLTRAVLDGYRALLPQGRYPAAVLFVEMPAAAVDVNVHPAKSEVRFAASDAVHGAVSRAVKGALAAGVVAPAAASPTPSTESAPASRVEEALAAYARRAPATDASGVDGGAHESTAHPRGVRAYSLRRLDAASPTPGRSPAIPGDGAAARAAGSARVFPAPVAHTAAASPCDDSSAAVPRFADLRVLGQAFTGWIVCEGADALVLVDQHAAHERVRFERLRAQTAGGIVASQRLLAPVTVEIERTAATSLLARRDELAAAGFEIEEFGERTLVVRALPAALDVTSDALTLLRDLAADLAELGASERLEHARDVLLARIACHGAVRAGQSLEPLEMRELLADLDTIPFAATCPHGRPLLADIPRSELVRRVRRS